MSENKPMLSIHPRSWPTQPHGRDKSNTSKTRDKNKMNTAAHEKHISQHPRDLASIAHMQKRIAS